MLNGTVSLIHRKEATMQKRKKNRGFKILEKLTKLNPELHDRNQPTKWSYELVARDDRLKTRGQGAQLLKKRKGRYELKF